MNIFQLLLPYMTVQNLTFVLALIGSIGTLSSFILAYVRSRVSINAEITSYYLGKDYLELYMVFSNASRLPVSITNVSIICDGNTYYCERSPQVAKTTEHAKNGQVVDTVRFWTISFPVNLPSLSGSSGYLLFRFHPENAVSVSKALTFQLSTNRNAKPLEMILSVPTHPGLL